MSSDKGMLLVFQEPQTRSVIFQAFTHYEYWYDQVDQAALAVGITTARLKFPYMMFAITYDRWYSGKYYKYGLNRLQVAFSQKPLTGNPAEKLFGLPMLNTDEGHTVCLGSPAPVIDRSLTVLAKKCIDLYWRSAFADYRDDFSYWVDEYGEKWVKKWKQSSKLHNGSFVMKEKLRQGPYLVDINRLIISSGVEKVKILKV
jgi:hypothetical protein